MDTLKQVELVKDYEKWKQDMFGDGTGMSHNDSINYLLEIYEKGFSDALTAVEGALPPEKELDTYGDEYVLYCRECNDCISEGECVHTSWNNYRAEAIKAIESLLPSHIRFA